MKYRNIISLALVLFIFSGVLLAQVNDQELTLNYNEGMKSFKQKNYSLAIEYFTALTELKPDYNYAYYMIGLSYMVQKKFDNALKYFNLAVEKGKNDFEIWSNIANIYYYKKDYGRAVKELGKLDPSGLDEPSRQKYYALKGKLSYVNKNFGAAISDLKKSVAIAGDPKVYSMLGASLYYQGKYKEAVSALNKSKGTEQDLKLAANSNISLAKQSTSASEKSSYYKAALVNTGKLIAKKANNFDYVNLHGQAQLGAKKYSDAVASFKKALGLKPGNCRTTFNLGMAYQGAGDWNSALANYLKATKCMPKDNTVWYFTGWAHENLGKKDEKNGKIEQARAKYVKATEAYNKSDSLKKGSRKSDLGRVAALIENIDIEKENLADAQATQAAAQLRQRVLKAITFSDEEMKIESGIAHIFGRVNNNSEKSPVEVSVKLEIYDSEKNILKTRRFTSTVISGKPKELEASTKISSLNGEPKTFKFFIDDVVYE